MPTPQASRRGAVSITDSASRASPGGCIRRFLAAFVAAVAFAGAHNPAAASDCDDLPRCVTDARGRSVALAAPARRIVALAPHIVENLFAIGAGNQVVAAVEYSDYPTAARDLPRVGGVSGLSLERIVAQQPDLVIAWDSGTDTALIAALEALGIPVYRDEIRSLDDLAASLGSFGVLSGHEARARDAVHRIQATLDRAALRHRGEGISVFLQIWDQPLQSVGRDHLLTRLIARCGGRSITAALPGLAPQVSLEAVLDADPELIVVESTRQGAHWQRFPTLRAVAAGNVRVIDPDVLQRPTLRLLDGFRELCRLLGDPGAG
jgi:iron complex transport system substrate-binding protein